MKERKRRKILFADILVEKMKGRKKEQITLKDVVIKEEDVNYKNMKIIKVISFKQVGETNINNQD